MEKSGDYYRKLYFLVNDKKFVVENLLKSEDKKEKRYFIRRSITSFLRIPLLGTHSKGTIFMPLSDKIYEKQHVRKKLSNA